MSRRIGRSGQPGDCNGPWPERIFLVEHANLTVLVAISGKHACKLVLVGYTVYAPIV